MTALFAVAALLLGAGDCWPADCAPLLALTEGPCGIPAVDLAAPFVMPSPVDFCRFTGGAWCAAPASGWHALYAEPPSGSDGCENSWLSWLHGSPLAAKMQHTSHETKCMRLPYRGRGCP